MIWRGSALIDAPVGRAGVAGDTLTFGTATLRLTSTSPADVRAVAPDGSAFRVRKAGLTVLRYRADCAGRAYALNRTSGTRREIIDAEGRVVARTRALAGGDLEVDLADLAEPLDVAFMSWALTYVDTPTRRTRI